MSQVRSDQDPGAVIDMLVSATNDHDLETIVACFANDYINETPAHPPRGFQGREQVRRNWTQILAAVPDIRANVLRRSVEDQTVWTEWEMSGTRRDGSAFLMRGVILFEVTGNSVKSARFYLEPVEDSSGDVNAAVSRVTHGGTAETERAEPSS